MWSISHEYLTAPHISYGTWTTWNNRITTETLFYFTETQWRKEGTHRLKDWKVTFFLPFCLTKHAEKFKYVWNVFPQGQICWNKDSHQEDNLLLLLKNNIKKQEPRASFGRSEAWKEKWGMVTGRERERDRKRERAELRGSQAESRQKDKKKEVIEMGQRSAVSQQLLLCCNKKGALPLGLITLDHEQ